MAEKMTRMVNVFDDTERMLCCVSNSDDLGTDTSVLFPELVPGKLYEMEKGRAKPYGGMVFIKASDAVRGYPACLFEEINEYPKKVLNEANASWIRKCIEKGFKEEDEE